MSNLTSPDTLQAVLEKANKRQWDAMHEHLQPTVTYNGKPESSDHFIHRLAEKIQGSGIKLRMDGLTTDSAAQSVAGRLVTTAQHADGNTFEVWDMILLFVEDGRVSRFYQVAERISRHLKAPTVPAFTTKPSKEPLSATQLKHAYLKYIDDINARRMHTTVAEHFAEEAVAEGNILDRRKLSAFYENVIQPITAGLKYVVEELVIDAEKQQVAAKLCMQGAPENERVRGHFGGGEVKLDEIAMYGLTDGKISTFAAAPPDGLFPEPPAVASR